MRTLRVQARKRLEDAIAAAAAAKGTSREGPLAHVAKDYLRRLHGPDR